MADTWHKFLEQGFNKIDHDLSFLRECLQEVFEEMDEKPLSKLLTETSKASSKTPLPPRGAQAISIYFQLMNMVEENAANQTMRARESALGLTAEQGLWGHYLKRLHGDGVKVEAILEKIRQTTVEPVLTAHPTESKRWSVLDQHRALYLNLVKLENQMFTPAERSLIREEIKAGLERLWRTGEILMTKPDVRSERKNALYYFREKFPDVLELLDQRFLQAWEDCNLGKQAREKRVFPRLRFGSWVGGDRDGHPLVTAEVTRITLGELRENAVRVLDAKLDQLQEQLGLSTYVQKTPVALQRRCTVLRKEAGPAGEIVASECVEEPWREFINLVRLNLPHKQSTTSKPYQFASELKCDLELLYEGLVTIGAPRIAEANVLPAIRLVEVFGFHLASLDVRQNSAFHDRAVSQLLVAAGVPDGKNFPSWPEAQRLAFLENELLSPRPFCGSHTPLGAEARAVLDVYQVLASHMSTKGRSGLGALIISMTRDVSDLLVVYLLAREAGLVRSTKQGLVCLLPVVPLFETLEDLENSPRIMQAYLKHPITQRSLPWQIEEYNDLLVNSDLQELTLLNRGSQPLVQQIMLGYSDSNKDCGIMASQWGLQTAQALLIQTCQKCGVTPLFFHGRGGTISRGAGPTHRFLEALPQGALDGGLRLTEQGEMVAQKFTNRKTSAYNLELMVAGAVGISLTANRFQPLPELTEVMNDLTAYSRDAYRAIVDDPDFMNFYRQATPIDVLEASRIGSRPSRRTGKASLDDLRAIPWVFSWNQSRFYLPGWFGVGSALEKMEQVSPERYAKIGEQAGRWPFLRYLLTNVETNLSSTDTDVMAAYASLVEDTAVRKRLLNLIMAEFNKTRDQIEKALRSRMEQRRPRFIKTLRARDNHLRILHHEQIRLLREWRAAIDAEKTSTVDKLLPDLLLTVNAIASGLRTTG